MEAEIAAGRRTILLVLPTGAGKTVTLGAVTGSATANHAPPNQQPADTDLAISIAEALDQRTAKCTVNVLTDELNLHEG